MNRGSCVDCEEQDAVIRDQLYGDELCSTCLNKRLKTRRNKCNSKQ